jgi:hypothetical protein
MSICKTLHTHLDLVHAALAGLANIRKATQGLQQKSAKGDMHSPHNQTVCVPTMSFNSRTCSSVAPNPLYSPTTPSSATMQRRVLLMPW